MIRRTTWAKYAASSEWRERLRRVGKTIEPCVVGDEGDDALTVTVSGDAAVGYTEEAYIEIVEALALWGRETCDGGRGTRS